MSPVTKNQKTLSCIALAIANGETPKSYSAQAAKMAESMSKEKLESWCKGPMKKE